MNSITSITSVCIDIGSNINRKDNIQSCVDKLLGLFPDIQFSQTVESEALGFDGPPFYNLSAVFSTDLQVEAVIKILKDIENQQARKRSKDKFISRTLDVDILLFGEQIFQPEYDIPRQEITKFPFVLYPLSEVAGSMIHPVIKQTIKEMADKSKLDSTTLTTIKNFPKY